MINIPIAPNTIGEFPPVLGKLELPFPDSLPLFTLPLLLPPLFVLLLFVVVSS